MQLKELTFIIPFFGALVSFQVLTDDSMKYVRVVQVQLPGSIACASGTWSTMVSSNYSRKIRVHYNKTLKGVVTPMVCDTQSLSQFADTKVHGTLLGCSYNIDYKITSAEYIR
jgi:hypothetical protein